MLTSLLSIPPLLAVARVWYAAPLIVAISLVYGATRHERMPSILDHALRFGSWIVGFMLVIFGLMLLLNFLT